MSWKRSGAALARAGLRRLPEAWERRAHRALFARHDTFLAEYAAGLAAAADRPGAALFVHVPRAAGSAINRHLPGLLCESHLRLDDYRRALGNRRFAALFKFAFVRNPWDRLVSSYFHLKRGGNHDRDRELFERDFGGAKDFDDFVTNWLTPAAARSSNWHFVPMAQWLRLPGERRIGVDFLGRYESLDADLARIAERLGRPAAPMPRVNESPDRSDDFRRHYTDRTRGIVTDLYREDIEAFGYEFEAAGGHA